ADYDGNEVALPLDVPNLSRAVRPGNRILLDDGKLELQVTRVIGRSVETRVILGGVLMSHKGVNLPGTDLGIDRFTEKDRTDLEFGLANRVDFVAISFVESEKDIKHVRDLIQQLA